MNRATTAAVRRFATIAAMAGLGLACLAQPAKAQAQFPNRPLQFIVPWGAGGGSDRDIMQPEIKRGSTTEMGEAIFDALQEAQRIMNSSTLYPMDRQR